MDKGTYYKPNSFSRWRRSFCERVGFLGLKLHELRHTQATRLLANGIGLETVQSRLGHADPTLTMSFYAHALPEKGQQAVTLIGSPLSQPVLKGVEREDEGQERFREAS